jgi:hypothetical protein
LKKGLNAVLSLHGNVDAVDLAIRSVTQAISDAVHPGDETRDLVDGLTRTQERLKQKVETLYSSLNIHTIPPALRAADREFVRVLFMARDLKANIRRRAIGSFFEWDRLDQAVGGRHQALGTCLNIVDAKYSFCTLIQARSFTNKPVRLYPDESLPFYPPSASITSIVAPLKSSMIPHTRSHCQSHCQCN